MILDTSHNTQQVKKLVSKSFKVQIWAKTYNFLHLLMLSLSEFQVFAIYEKTNGLELRVIISANINSTIAVILSPNLSLYDLQKPRYDC